MIRERLEKEKLEAAEQKWFDELRSRYSVKVVANDLECTF